MRKHTTSGLGRSVTVVVIALTAAAANAQGPKGADAMAELKAAWKARQERFKTVQMKWTARKWFAKGGISESLPPLALKGSKLQIQPPEDTSFTVPYQLTLDGVKVRVESKGRQWDATEGRFNANRWISTYDGNQTKECYVEREGEERWPRGVVSQKGAFAGARSSALRAPFLFFRPLEPQHYGIALEPFTLSSRTTKVRGYECLELKESMHRGTFQVWVDAKRDYVVVRHLSVINGKPSFQIDYDYREDAKWGPTLSGWQATSMSNRGNVTSTSKVTADESIVNELIAIDKTDLAFPSGGIVHENGGDAAFVVREDGSKRYVTSHDLKRPYDQLIEMVKKEKLRSRLLTTALVIVALASFGYFVYRRFSARVAPSAKRASADTPRPVSGEG
jgi:hypothetical protein